MTPKTIIPYEVWKPRRDAAAVRLARLWEDEEIVRERPRDPEKAALLRRIGVPETLIGPPGDRPF